MSLVIFTAFAGMVVAPGHIHPVIGFIAILCIAVGAGASGALNMWYDADIDAVMSRTATRPIPSGRILPGEALAFGITLSGFSVAVLGLAVNALAAGLLAFTIFFYAVIYTMWLKRWTPQNIVIGGAAGAFPPMIGWAAVTGGVSIESITLFLIIFLWTPAHFWALALFKMRDYGAVGVPMLPNVSGEKVTKDQILIYAVLTAAAGVAPAFLGFASLGYGLVAVILGAAFIWFSVLCRRMPDGDTKMVPAKKLFAFSILYLFAIFSCLMIDHYAILAWSGMNGDA
jgi:protoheme IX farnesyltransferase